ncbi:hypothetical protein GCM10028787_29630 [Brachybacterium horti]
MDTDTSTDARTEYAHHEDQAPARSVPWPVHAVAAALIGAAYAVLISVSQLGMVTRVLLAAALVVGGLMLTVFARRHWWGEIGLFYPVTRLRGAGLALRLACAVCIGLAAGFSSWLAEHTSALEAAGVGILLGAVMFVMVRQDDSRLVAQRGAGRQG